MVEMLTVLPALAASYLATRSARDFLGTASDMLDCNLIELLPPEPPPQAARMAARDVAPATLMKPRRDIPLSKTEMPNWLGDGESRNSFESLIASLLCFTMTGCVPTVAQQRRADTPPHFQSGSLDD